MDQKRARKQMKFMHKNSSAMRLAGEKWPKRWQTLIAIMLSAQARDEVTIPIAQELFKEFSNVGKNCKS